MGHITFSKSYSTVLATATMLLLALVSTPMPASNKGDTEKLTGRDIFDQMVERHDRPFEYEEQTMSLIDRRGAEEKRQIRRYSRKAGDDEKRIAMLFTVPKGIKGVALLTWQHADKQDDQWLFLPAQSKKMKRIAKGGKKNYFMGTDYTFEDLASESQDKFTYSRMADEENKFVIKVTPSDPELLKETGYKHRTFWISKDHFLVEKIEYFDRRERLIKRQTNENFEQIEDSAWRATKSTMEHLRKKHKTIIEVANRRFSESDVPEKVFQKRTITSGKLVR